MGSLRYGENPTQEADLWSYISETGLTHQRFPRTNEAALPGASLLNGEMSFNNYVDGDSALNLVKELTRAQLSRHAVAFIKHTNACGCAIGENELDTYRRAYLGDPVAAAGGVLCMNFPVTRKVAETAMNSYATWGKAAGAAFFKLDVWIAPSFDQDAIELITTPTEKRKWGSSCRLIAVGPMDTPPDENELDYKKIIGGMLVQSRDLLGLNEEQWKVVTERAPTERELADLRFAWLVCKHTKSNAITICRDGQLLGSGAGQMSRVKSCDLAVQLSRENGHGDKLAGAVAAGDAFFPVEDGPRKLIAAGITAIIHPGGSNRDANSIQVANEAKAAMIMTGTRHFKH
jgi:phosphoribosylaminoimidazolecarboxamide formyltransferase/IMP cyclohydrolase